jgi:predicted TIM-barrel fold metal-dependent hydrolase
MIVDFRIQPPYKSFLGIHFYRPRPRDVDPIKSNSFDLTRRPVRSFETQDMGDFVREMDEAGVDVGVIMGQKAADRWGSADNEHVAELVEQYPGRFYGFGGVDPMRPGAVAETRRCIEDLGCRGVSILPGWSDPPLYDDDGRVYPIYEMCNELGAMVMITSSHWIGADMSYSMPVHIMKVALDYPDLTIIVGHGCWPWTTQACAMAMRCNNVYLMPEFYMYIPNMPGAGDYVQAANGYLAYRMLFSSCYPSRAFGQALEEFWQLPIEPASQALLLGENGARLLGLTS